MKKIVVIAHDKFKKELYSFLNKRRTWFFNREIVSTGRTAEFLENENLDLALTHVKKGRDGGYIQITEMITNNEIDMVFFFRDPSIKQEYHQDIINLLNACDYKSIPLSTNNSAAELLIVGKIRMEAANQVLKRVNN